MGFEGFPIVLGWELTLACNLRCTHCASSAGAERPDELSLAETLAVCDQLPALLVREVDFTGGEPLLSALWASLVPRLSEYGIISRLVTNGLLLGEKAADLAAAGIAGVGISVDGLPSTHDEIRAHPGLFSRLVEGIRAAQDVGVMVSAITAVSDRNIDELGELESLLAGLGITRWQLQPVFARGRARDHDFLALSERTYERLCSFVFDECRRQDHPEMVIMPADGIGYRCSSDVRGSPWCGCFAGISACGITSNGMIKGCLSLPDSTVEGSLRERSLWDIWFSEQAFSYSRRTSSAELGSLCSWCPEGEACKGGCSIMSYAYTGSFHNDPYCIKGIEARRCRVDPPLDTTPAPQIDVP